MVVVTWGDWVANGGGDLGEGLSKERAAYTEQIFFLFWAGSEAGISYHFCSGLHRRHQNEKFFFFLFL